MKKKYDDVFAVISIEERKDDPTKSILKLWEYYNNGYNLERRAKRFYDGDDMFHLIGFSRKDGKFNLVKSMPSEERG